MNAERLHAIIIALSQEMANTQSTENLERLINALQNVVNQPNAPNQQNLSESLKAMYSALTDTPSDKFSPAWRQVLSEIGGESLVGTLLKSNIEGIFARNQITPAVALDELRQVFDKLRSFKNALNQCISSLGHFHIGNEKLSPGECEIGVLVPRKIVKNQLPDLVKELKEIEFILNTFSEVATGRKDELQIRSISSSDFLVFLQAIPQYAALVAVAIERTVALYRNLLEIRKLKQEIKKQGVPEEHTAGIEHYAKQHMETGIEKIAIEIVNEYCKKSDKGRKNELTNAVRICLNKIANRIDQGFNIEVRVEPIGIEKEKENAELQKSINAIQSALANMQYLKLEGQPILSLPETEKDTKKKEKGQIAASPDLPGG